MLYDIILLCLFIVVAVLIVLREITFRRALERYGAYNTALQTLVYNLVRIKDINIQVKKGNDDMLHRELSDDEKDEIAVKTTINYMKMIKQGFEMIKKDMSKFNMGGKYDT